MAVTDTHVIGDYTAALTIDGGTHFLLIQPGSSSTAYRKITRNVFLGVSGQPADVSTSQSLTNKTFDNTNTLTLKDTLFTLQDDSDTTKQARFQLSGITTATTRTYTLPNASSALADLTTAQTLTNKTLTSPTISGGTIDNSTITVDAIGEHTVANGVTIDGMNIKDGALNSNNSVVTANVTDGAITPAKLLAGTGSGWTWQAYTPTFTNATVGNGSSAGKYIQVGKTVFFSARFTFGSTSSFSGAISFSLPIPSVSYTTAYSKSIGNVVCLRPGGGASYFGQAFWTSTTTAEPDVGNAAGTYVQGNAITATVPQTWQTADILDVTGFYEAA